MTHPEVDPVADILEREWRSVTDLLAASEPDDWDRPTRCAGWTVSDLTRHVVWGVSMEAEALRRARISDPEPADGVTLPASTGARALLDALRGAADDLVTEVRSLGPDAEHHTCPMPYGATPLPLALHVFVFEAGIHASDFAHAVGADRPLAEDVVPATTTVLLGFLPVFASGGTNRPPDGTTFSLRGTTVALDGRWEGAALVLGEGGGAPDVTVAGDDSSVLLFTVGRLAADDPRLTVHGDRALARDFKVHVPGP